MPVYTAPLDESLTDFVISSINNAKRANVSTAINNKSKDESMSKYMLKNLSRRNRVIKDSFKLKVLRRPYSKDEHSTVLERVGFPQRKQKNKQDLARISFYVKRKFEKQFQETTSSFAEYISKNNSQSTSNLRKDKIEVSNLTPVPRLTNTIYSHVMTENCYDDSQSKDFNTSQVATTANNSLFITKSKI